jgi:hypothetical protein
LIAEHAEEPDQVVVVKLTAACGYQRWLPPGIRYLPSTPLAVARYRDRHHISGAKSDVGDAKLLADLVRTDRHNHRSIAGVSATAEAIKVLARGHQTLIWTRTRSRPVLLCSPFPVLLVTDAADKQTIMRAKSFIHAARYITSSLLGCQNLHRLQSHPARPRSRPE